MNTKLEKVGYLRVCPKILRFGFDEKMDSYEARRVCLSNKLLGIGFVSLIIFVLNDIYMQLYIPAMLLASGMLIVLFSLYLNYKNYTTASAFIAVEAVSIIITINSYLIIGDVGIQYILLALIGIPALNFSLEKKKMMFLSMLLSGLMAGTVVAMDFQSVGIYQLSEANRLALLFGSFIQAFVLITAQIFIFLFEMDRRFDLYKENQSQMYSQSRMSDLGLISAGIAHEINNPMTVIQLNTQLLKRGIERGDINTEKFKSRTMTILKHCNRILKIVNGLKYVARDGSQDPFEKIDIRQTIIDLIIITQEKFKNDEIQIETILPNYMVIVEARAVQIEQVLLSLLSNASDAVEGRLEKKIKISLFDDSDSVHVLVEDSGDGVPEKIKDDIMKPFFTTKPVGKGTGLGLSVAKGIMEEHKGNLHINHASKGGGFILTLPLVEVVRSREKKSA